MIEDVDAAQVHEQMTRDDAIASRATVPVRGHGSHVCDRCHGDVAFKRYVLGYRVCVDCQTDIESKAGRQ